MRLLPMWPARRLPYLFLTMLAVACNPPTQGFAEADRPAQAAGTAPQPKNPFAMPTPLPRPAEVSPPEPGEVLRAIYKKAGNGSANYGIGKGIWVSYWYGHSYLVDGQRYFTGFAYNTEAGSADSDFPAPGDRVSISQATYVLAPGGSVTDWEFVGAERDIGRFGGRERGNAIDDDVAPQSHFTPSGEYLLAVPAWYMETGVRVNTAEIFRLQSEKRHWQYLGSVSTGEDNSAACAEFPGDDLPPCAISLGELTFRQQQGKDMPSILVAMKGKVVASAGVTGTRRSLDTHEYYFDQTTGQYR